MPHVGKGKKVHHKQCKMPEGAGPMKKCTNVTLKRGQTLKKDVEAYCTDILASDFHPHTARPPPQMQGYYVICRWFAREKSWVVLYADCGCICSKIESHFSGKEKSPLGFYLASYPKTARNLIWMKWLAFTEESRNFKMSDVLDVIGHCYNGGEIPAFNLAEEPEIPEGFSILG